MAHGGANLPGHQRILFAGIVAHQQEGRRRGQIAHASQRSAPGGTARASSSHAGVIGGAVMIDVVGADGRASDASEQIVLFVGGAVRADDADGLGAALGSHGGQARRGVLQRLFPGRRRELAAAADQRLAQALGMLGEVEPVAALDAQELAVDAGAVAIVAADDLARCARRAWSCSRSRSACRWCRRASSPTAASGSGRCRW